MRKADFGQDAPGVVRNLVLAGAAGLLVAVLVAGGILSGSVIIGGAVRVVYSSAAWSLAIGCLGMACYMVWDSRVGKVEEREKLLSLRNWRGDEHVLDAGCGRGLMLVGAAKRVHAGGLAVGVDLWQSEDLSGNSSDAPVANARAEGVDERVCITTGDLRALPFGSETFDVVVSRAAIHNIYDSADRAGAIREIARVLKPGGEALILDIRHGSQYLKVFREAGCPDAQDLQSKLGAALAAAITFGSLLPCRLHVRKAPTATVR